MNARISLESSSSGPLSSVEALLFVVGFININVAENFSSYFETVSEYKRL